MVHVVHIVDMVCMVNMVDTVYMVDDLAQRTISYGFRVKKEKE